MNSEVLTTMCPFFSFLFSRGYKSVMVVVRLSYELKKTECDSMPEKKKWWCVKQEEKRERILFFRCRLLPFCFSSPSVGRSVGCSWIVLFLFLTTTKKKKEKIPLVCESLLTLTFKNCFLRLFSLSPSVFDSLPPSLSLVLTILLIFSFFFLINVWRTTFFALFLSSRCNTERITIVVRTTTFLSYLLLMSMLLMVFIIRETFFS